VRNPLLVILLTLVGIVGGVYALFHTPLDAIPDLSDVQVIVYTDWPGRSPDLIEDQITYPITTKFIAGFQLSKPWLTCRIRAALLRNERPEAIFLISRSVARRRSLRVARG
jgi:hypothetical protein